MRVPTHTKRFHFRFSRDNLSLIEKWEISTAFYPILIIRLLDRDAFCHSYELFKLPICAESSRWSSLFTLGTALSWRHLTCNRTYCVNGSQLKYVMRSIPYIHRAKMQLAREVAKPLSSLLKNNDETTST